MVNGSRPPLPVFTTFRFFAALGVLMHHAGFMARDHRLAGFYRTVCYEGYAGVTFFFILSGFILTYNYRPHFEVLRRRRLWSFYSARFARVYPVHALSFFAVFLISPHLLREIRQHAGPTAANLALLHGYFPSQDYYFSQNPVSWSLCDEFFFYAMLPLLLRGLAALRLTSLPRAFGVGAVTWAIAFTLNCLGRDHPNSHWLFYINPLFRMSDFILGVCLALVTVCRAEHPTLRHGVRFHTALELGSLALLAGAVCCAGYVAFPIRIGSYYSPFMGLVIFAFSSQGGLISRLLSPRPFRFLGEISFSIYMFHLIVLELLVQHRAFWGMTRLGTIGFTEVYIGATIAVSACCFVCFEVPMRTGLKALLMPKRNKAVMPAVESEPALRVAA